MRSRTANWFETKIRYEKTMDDGKQKAVTELYVVDALSFTEAEAEIIQEMSAYITGDFKVTGISQAPYSEIFFSDADTDDRFYKTKLQFITIDEKTEKEKLTNVLYLVQAESLPAALKNIQNECGSTGLDYTIVGLNETKIVDVLPSD